jgi:predicted RNase H-like nuclease (RuvC/YqgF family)
MSDQSEAILSLAKERDALQAEVEQLRRSRDDHKRYLDAIAEVLHPHKPKDGWTYVPDQLAGMVRDLRQRCEALEAALKGALRDLELCIVGHSAPVKNRCKAALDAAISAQAHAQSSGGDAGEAKEPTK